MIPAKIEQFLKGMNEPDFFDREHLDACTGIHDLVREYVENGTETIEVKINVDLLLKAEKVLRGLGWTVEEALVLYLLWCIVCPEQMKGWYEKVRTVMEMKKIPTLFKREFQDHRVISISPELSSPDLAWVLAGEGIATEKIDGACCAIINGRFYKRYDAKKNKKGVMKTPPANAIPCDEPDPVTGHWPHWVTVDETSPADSWFIAARANTPGELRDGTYEAIRPHFNSNPHGLDTDVLVRHGEKIIPLAERTFDSIRNYLTGHNIEGIVFWKDGQPRCKIKRKDFGFRWPEENTQQAGEDG